MSQTAEQFALSELSQVPDYVPSPTVDEMMWAFTEGPAGEMRVIILEGPRGEGKTTAGFYACLAFSDRLIQDGLGHLLPVRVALIRDTWVSIERTTIESFKEQGRRGVPIEFLKGNREAKVTLGGVERLHFFFFGVDTPGDVDKLQGFSCGVLWPEEVAPAAGLTSGIPQDVFGVGATSVRQTGVPPRILVTMNPPDPDAWILKVEEYLRELGLQNVKVGRFNIPKNEKSDHFRLMARRAVGTEQAEAWTSAAEEFENYTTRNRAFLESIGRMDLVNRLVLGLQGEVQVGEPVLPADIWSRAAHVASGPLPTFPRYELLLGLDGGGTPSAVFAQDLRAANDKVSAGLNVLGSFTLDNGSMEALLRDWVLPFMQKYGLLGDRGPRDSYGASGRRPGYTLRIIGDPSLQWEGATVKSENASGYVIQEMLGAPLEPGPVEWDARRQAMIACFSRAGRGDRPRFVQIDPEENDMLIKSLGGRFRYPRDMKSGNVNFNIQAAKKASGIFGQSADALFYIMAVLYPAHEWLRAHQRTPTPSPRVLRPASYLGF